MPEETENTDQLLPEVTSVFRLSREAIVTHQLDGTITAWNQSAERIFGYTSKEMIGQSVEKLVPVGNSDQFSLLAEVRRGKTIEDFRTQRKHKDGRMIDVSLAVSPIRDQMGRVVGVLCISLDIGERIRLDRAERDQVFLASIVSSADDAIISKDLEGTVTTWNQAAEKIFGYTPEEMIGQPISKLMTANHLDEEPQILERIRRGERIDHYESERLRKDGRIIQVSLTISPIRDHMGRIVGASQIARDMTERRRLQIAESAQSFLGALVDSAEDPIISKNLDGIVTSWNPAAQKLFQYTAQEMIGQSISILIPSDHGDEEPEILKRIRRGERLANYETQRRRKDGSIVNVSLTVSPIRNSLGQIIGASKIVRDITENKHAETRERERLKQIENAMREAEEARQLAEQASIAKDEFLATVSHELRTPITAILGWTYMLANGQVSSEQQQKAFAVIERNARSQAQLIEDLLDISRITSGKMRIDFATVDLTVVIGAAVESVRPAAEAKGIRIDSLFSSGAGPILGDAERLQQVMWNLLSNAIKFTPRGGVVRIEIARVESQVELRVIDNGAGIDPNFLPHVFDRFSQADTSIKRTRAGLGMGLAIVKSLVEMHGGVISASSPGEGLGSVFTIKLPFSAVRQDSIRGRPSEKLVLQGALKERANLVGLKILIVDDDADTRDMLRTIFNQCGSIVETAPSAEAALRLCDSWQPDILVSDIGMPEVDGYEFIRILREERGSRIPAVALTAMARIEDRLKALTAGYQMHVSKPVNPAELTTIVGNLVGLVSRRLEP